MIIKNRTDANEFVNNVYFYAPPTDASKFISIFTFTGNVNLKNHIYYKETDKLKIVDITVWVIGKNGSVNLMI